MITAFLGSLEKILIIAFSLPVDVGLNVTLIAHELPFATTVQLFVWPNSPAFVPANIIAFTVRSDVPVFLIVTILGADVLPTPTEPKLTDLGEAVIFGGGACPESFTLMVGFLGSLDEMLIMAVLLTNGGTGANVTVIGHELFAGTIEQLFDSMNSD